jgi:hypothetical protein
MTAVRKLTDAELAALDQVADELAWLGYHELSVQVFAIAKRGE